MAAIPKPDQEMLFKTAREVASINAS